MSKPLITEQLPTDLREHRAVVAWNRVHPAKTTPKRLEILKLKNKSTVYRLVGAGPRGASVIAKRSLTDTAQVERIIHQEFMPQFHLPSLRYYGFLEESDGGIRRAGRPIVGSPFTLARLATWCCETLRWTAIASRTARVWTRSTSSPWLASA